LIKEIEDLMLEDMANNVEHERFGLQPKLITMMIIISDNDIKNI
jgi:hypothetical protein